MVEYMVGIPRFENRIYAGRVMKDDSMSDTRTDVTVECVNCVVEHLRRNLSQFGMDSVDCNGWRLTISKIPDRTCTTCRHLIQHSVRCQDTRGAYIIPGQAVCEVGCETTFMIDRQCDKWEAEE